MRPQQKGLLLRMLQDVCSVTGKLPSCYALEAISHDGSPFTYGGEFFIFRGTWRSARVAIRRPRCLRDGWNSESAAEALKV